MNYSSKLHLAGLAAAALLAGSAQATVIYSGALNTAIPDNGIGLYVNVIDGSTFTGPGTFPTLGGPGANYDFNIFGGTTSWNFFSPGTSGQSAPTPVPTTSKGYVAASATGAVLSLATGTLIDGNSVFNTGTAAGTGVATGQMVYFGFRFRNENDPANAADDTIHFGWALIMLPDPTLTQNGVLLGYAFESTPGLGIAVGAIPEPGTIALVGAAGVAAVAVARRRRR